MVMYTGVRVLEVKPEIINELYAEKKISTSFNKTYKFFQNEYVVIKDNTGGAQSAITRVYGENLVLLKLPKDLVISSVKPRNKEQWMAFDALLDDNVKVVTLTGRAGTGKTLLTLATALHKVEQKGSTYERIILTRPMSWVGKHGLGALPGEVEEKFNPYLENYMCNITHLMGGEKRKVIDVIERYNMEFVPLQLIRGASWSNAFIIADEVQVLDYQEFVAVGTRIGEGSKIVIMGDLGQRDEDIAKEKTGLYKFVNDIRAKESPLVASIELLKSERSEVCSLFADVFEV
jgi:PhoH-like ATPase